VRRNSK